MNKCFIQNAIWAADGSAVDLLLEEGLRSSIQITPESSITIQGKLSPHGEQSPPANAQIINGSGKILLPALVDLHAKANKKGQSTSQAVERCNAAAIKGGVGHLLIMSAEGLSFDSPAVLDSFSNAVHEHASCHIQAAGSITLQNKGEQQAPYNTLAARGIRILSDADHSPQNLLMLHRAMKYIAELDLTMAIRGDVPELSKNTYVHPSTTSYLLGLHGTPACAEEIGIETIIRLAEDAGAKLHIQSISTKRSLDIIRGSDKKVSAEVALHHLIFTHKDIADYNTSFKTLPPLRDASDRDALIEGIKDGSIDCIVSDHSPCDPFAKKQDFPSAPQGMITLDSYLPSIYTHLIKPGKLDWRDILRACCTRPMEILYGDNAPDMQLILFDPDYSCIISPEELPSGVLNSPHLGERLEGRVIPLS